MIIRIECTRLCLPHNAEVETASLILAPGHLRVRHVRRSIVSTVGSQVNNPVSLATCEVPMVSSGSNPIS